MKRGGVLADRQGIVAIEFALTGPFLLLLAGGIADYSLAFWNKGLLTSSVAQGAEYASRVGTTVIASDVKTVVQQRLSLPSANVTVAGPSCYCITGTPASATAKACGVACSGGSMPGTFVDITASYTYIPTVPGMSALVSPTFISKAKVRLQ